MQTRVGRLERTVERLRDVLHVELLHFVKHKDLALFLRKLFEELREPAAEVLALETRGLAPLVPLLGELALQDFTPKHGFLAVFRSDPHRDPINPGAQGRAALKALKAPLDDQEDLMRDVFQVRGADSEMAQAPKDIASILLVDLSGGG